MKAPRTRTAAAAVAVALFYVGFGVLGLKLAPANGFATLVWPPSGIALAACLLLGLGIWPAIALGAFIVNLWSGAPLFACAVIAVGNTLECVLGAWALRRLPGFDPALRRTRDVMALAVVAAALSTIVSATIGVSALRVAGIIEPAQFELTWRAWQLGDATGDLVMAPLILSWATLRPWPRVPTRRVLEALALGVAVAFTSLYVFQIWPQGGGAFRMTYWLAPLFVWAAFRFGQPGATATTFAISAVAIWSVMLGLSPLHTAASAHEHLVALDSLITVAALTNLLLAAATTERTQARKALRETNEALEQRVEDRTRELSEREAQVGASLREKELLLREMHHRVKNNLQIISSLLRLQRRSAADAPTQALLSDCEDRIRSIAFVHEELYRSNDLSTIDCQTYLQTLVASLRGAYELHPYSVSVEVDARDCALSIDRAIPCGLVVNELVSNALKHAFNERRRGHLSVVMTTDPDAKGYLLLVCDDGVGFPPGVDYRSTQTLGLKLVCSLVAQMHGVISLERDRCTRFIIRFPR